MSLQIRSKAIGVLFGATLGLILPSVGTKAERDEKTATGLVVVDQSNQEKPLHTFPKNVRNRIQQLLKQGFNPCPKYSPEIEKASKKRSAGKIDSEFCAEVNCFGTVLWVLSDEELPGYVGGRNFVELLIGLYGYRETRELRPFQVDKNNVANALKIDINKERFKPGDVLVFVSSRKGKRYNSHAVLYLGQVNGLHNIFMKRSSFCGPVSPYEITSLHDILLGQIGKSVQDRRGVGFDRIFVYSP